MAGLDRNIDDDITTWQCRLLSQQSALPETVRLRRIELGPLLRAAQQDVPYGARVAKRFGRKLYFGHVVAGNPPGDSTLENRLFTVIIKHSHD